MKKEKYIYVIRVSKNGKTVSFMGGQTIEDVINAIKWHTENSVYFEEMSLEKEYFVKAHLNYLEKDHCTSFFSSQKGFEDCKIHIVQDKYFYIA